MRWPFSKKDYAHESYREYILDYLNDMLEGQIGQCYYLLEKGNDNPLDLHTDIHQAEQAKEYLKKYLN